MCEIFQRREENFLAWYLICCNLVTVILMEWDGLHHCNPGQNWKYNNTSKSWYVTTSSASHLFTLLSGPRVTFSYNWPASLLVWFSPSLSLAPKIWGTSLWVMLHFWSLDYCKQNELSHLHILVGFCFFGDIFRSRQLLRGVPNKLNGGLTTEIGLFGSLAGPIKDFHPGGKLL